MAITREQILSSSDAKMEKVAVPEWGGDVHIKVMSGAERDRWEAAAFEGGKVNRDNFRARLLVETICDESGKLLFSPADVDALSAKSSAILSRLTPVALKINALTNDDVDALTKN